MKTPATSVINIDACCVFYKLFDQVFLCCSRNLAAYFIFALIALHAQVHAMVSTINKVEKMSIAASTENLLFTELVL